MNESDTLRAADNAVPSQQQARLPQFRDNGQMLKNENLIDQPITILDSLEVMRRDLTRAHKWLVEHADGTLGLYWAPGQAPPLQVAQWFRQYPGRPLHVIVRHAYAQGGRSVWDLEESADDAASSAQNGAGGAPTHFADYRAEQVPF